jgi:two-component system chemotaxis response regulator CheY
MAQKLLLEGKRVLLAEDEDFSRKIVGQMIGKLGCTALTTVGEGDSAAAALREAGPFDMVILDFRMPNRNGLELLKDIRVGLGDVPREQRVMMLTASGDYELLGAAMALDVDAFVTKPISLQQMAERIRGIFKLWGEYKTASRYREIDTDEVTRKLIAPTPKPAKADQEAEAARPKRGTLTKLENVRAGSYLAEDVTGPLQQLVLASGSRLSERLIQRLVEVKGVTKVTEIWVEPEEEKKP